MSHLCYSRRMSEVASRDLRNQTRAVLARVEAGEDVTITVDGRPVAVLQPVRSRPRWVQGAEFLRDLRRWQAEAALTRELIGFLPETTDDVRIDRRRAEEA